MFRKIKTRTTLGAVTAIMAITGASALGTGSAAHTQAAAVKTASITDVMSELKTNFFSNMLPKAGPPQCGEGDQWDACAGKMT
jgi:hypothetical protein